MEQWVATLLTGWDATQGVTSKEEDDPYAGSISANFASSGYGSIDQGISVSYLGGTCFEAGGAFRHNQGPSNAPFLSIYISNAGEAVQSVGQAFSLDGDADHFAVSFASDSPEAQSLSFDDLYLRVVECP
jgi:hypothetical protein